MSPLGGHEEAHLRRGLGCGLGSLDLVELDDLEARLAEQPEPAGQRQVELDAARLVEGVAPVEAVDREVAAPYSDMAKSNELSG